MKMNPIHVKSSICIDFDFQNNDKDPKFKVGDRVIISKYKNIFAKGYALNWHEQDFFLIKRLKNTVPSTQVITDLNG